MHQIDLPDYLKKSSILNNLSIRKLLQYWAIICALAVVCLSLTALVTNDIASSSQEGMDEVYIPVGNIARNLEAILTDLADNRKLIQSSSGLTQLDLAGRHNEIHQQVSLYLSRLSGLAIQEPELVYTIPRLAANFEDYFKYERLIIDIALKGDNVGGTDPVLLSKLDNASRELRNTLNRVSVVVFDRVRLLSDETHDLGQVNLMIVVVVSLLVIAVIMAGISLLIYRIDQPLHDLTEAMDDLSTGNMSRRMEVGDMVNDEFSNLAVDFNLFAQRLQTLFDEVTEARDSLQVSEQLTRTILENALVGIAYVKDGKLTAVNEKFEDLFGYDREALLGDEMEKLFNYSRDMESVWNIANPLLSSGNNYQAEWQMKHKSGHAFWCAISAKTLSEKNPEEGVIWLFEDITQRKNQENELLKLANFDTLTGLPNRSLFMDRLAQGINRSHRQKKLLGLLYIDLDRFKGINDSFGHRAGDDLLKVVASRLCECVRGSDTVCRLGGDEFTVVLPELNDISDAGKVAEKIIMVMDDLIKIEGADVRITPSIGVSIFPDDAMDIEGLLKNADSAMYHAKSRGRNNYQYYTQTMNAEARLRLDRESRVRHAVDTNQFRLYYQPQVDVETMTVTGYEALIRWQESDDKLVSPDEFVPLLEDSGLIVRVGEWILSQACKDIVELSRRNDNFKSVSINLSARQFLDEGITEKIKTIIQNSGVSPGQVVIEITESIMMTETERSLRILSDMSAMGLKLSLDDFGTGYSSLAYLRQFPIDVIKIDQSFVRGLQHNESDAAICEAIITIAKQLGLKVVAEGVETEEQYTYMRSKGCHSIQGYFFGQPTPLSDLVSKIH